MNSLFKRSADDLRGPLADAFGLKTAVAWSWVALVGAAAFVAAVALVLGGALAWDRDRRRFRAINAWWGVTCLRLIPITVELRGLEHIGEGPYVITANHQSMVDLLVTYLIPIPFRTVVKKSWFKGPFGLNLWAAGYIPTEKSFDPERASAVTDACAASLGKGTSILCFPEGTRARSWTMGRFKRGIFDVAVRSGVPVLPVAIVGTNDVSHPSSMRFRFASLRVIVEVLPAVRGQESAELRRACQGLMGRKVAELREALRVESGQGPRSNA